MHGLVSVEDELAGGGTWRGGKASGDHVLLGSWIDGGMEQLVELTGIDEAHTIEDVYFEAVTLNGKPLTRNQVSANNFIKNLVITP